MSRARQLLLLLFANLAVALLCELSYRAFLFLSTERPDASVQHFDLYGVGESTMVGEPYEPKMSIPRLLEYMFDGRLAGRPIALRNLAERAVSLYPQALAFERAMAARDGRAPGVVLIVSGHNEGIPPWSPGGDETVVPSVLIEQSALLRDMLLALRRRRFVAREHTLASYEHYLRRVIETAQRNGLLPVVATMASNISRIEPNYHGAAADVPEIVKRGVRLEEQGQYREARDLYVGALRGRAQGQAPLEYQAGRCEEALGNFAEARAYYWRAVDHDPRFPFGRATQAQNELVRQLAREYAIPIIDTVAILEAHSPHGILSAAWFADGQHPSLGGYVLLANAYADLLSARFATPIVRPLADADSAATALGLGAEDVRGAMVDAGSWLIATAVDHPLPRDRVAAASALFQGIIGQGDDFSAWLGLGLGQAALRGGLRSTDEIARACHYTKKYNLSPEDIAVAADRLTALGVDAAVVQRIRALGHASQ